ncbi:MAG: LLM class flavin-dependent oxidoreductase, partial [Acetobacteraceae bacterium]|nr:LLM class flavin-dependent oxidoreductase [Acetobacteraceae bacterium]
MTMRLGIVTIPRQLPPGAVMTDHFIAFAQKVEALDFHGLWVTDAFGRGRATMDPLSTLGLLCGVTKKIELGTCVIQVPIRHPVEHAHRVQTINLLSGGRFRFGVGTGSTKADFDVVQADFEKRFKVLPEMLEAMQRTWRGEPVYGPAVSVWPGTEGGPQMMLGAWRSPRWINLAARLDGWISSGIHSKLEDHYCPEFSERTVPKCLTYNGFSTILGGVGLKLVAVCPTLVRGGLTHERRK